MTTIDQFNDAMHMAEALRQSANWPEVTRVLEIAAHLAKVMHLEQQQRKEETK